MVLPIAIEYRSCGSSVYGPLEFTALYSYPPLLFDNWRGEEFLSDKIK